MAHDLSAFHGMRVLVLACLAACGRGPKPFVDVDTAVDRWDGLGIPLFGDIAFKAMLTSPTDELASASGTVTALCLGCAVGDGTTEHDFLGSPATIRIDLGAIDGTATFMGGRGILDLTGSAADGIELRATGTIALATTICDSIVDVHFAFHPTDALLKRDPKQYALASVTGARRSEDGWYHAYIAGPLAQARLGSD